MTPDQRTDLVDLVTLIAELDMPVNNTEAALVRRSGMSEETVAWGLDVLFNDGKGWLDAHDHPKTDERGYLLNARFDDDGDIEDLVARWSAAQADALVFDADDEDPDDEWADIDDEDDD